MAVCICICIIKYITITIMVFILLLLSLWGRGQLSVLFWCWDIGIADPSRAIQLYDATTPYSASARPARNRIHTVHGLYTYLPLPVTWLKALLCRVLRVAVSLSRSRSRPRPLNHHENENTDTDFLFIGLLFS